MLFLRYTPLQGACCCHFLLLMALFICGFSVVAHPSFAYGKNSLGGFPQTFGDSMTAQEPAPFASFDSMVPKNAPTLEMLELITQGGLEKLPPEVQKFLMTNKGHEPLPVLVSPPQTVNEQTVYSDKTSTLAKVQKPKAPAVRDPFVFSPIIPGMEPIFRPTMNLDSLPKPQPLNMSKPKIASAKEAQKVAIPQNPENTQVGKAEKTVVNTGLGANSSNKVPEDTAVAKPETNELTDPNANTDSNVSEEPLETTDATKSTEAISLPNTAPAPTETLVPTEPVENPAPVEMPTPTASQKKAENVEAVETANAGTEVVNLDTITDTAIIDTTKKELAPLQEMEKQEVIPRQDLAPNRLVPQDSEEKDLADILTQLNVNDIKLKAESGDASAQHRLGLRYYDGVDVEKDQKEGVKWIRESAAAEHLPAYVSMGKLWEQGGLGDINYENAGFWYKKAGDKGFADALFHLALLYDKGKLGDEKTAKRLAKDYYGQAAHMDHPRALYNLALFYDIGSDTERNMKQALELYKRSAQLGYAQAQLQLGLLYESGKYLPQDDILASEWYTKAAMQNLAEAQYLLADMYQQGRGIPQDFAKAMQLYEAAAHQGLVEAQIDLGLLYATDMGTYHDKEKGKEWLQKAAEQGNAQAQEALSSLETLGISVPQ